MRRLSNASISLNAVHEARRRIANIAYRTPLYFCPRLSSTTKANVYLKLECYQPTRVFKIRGAANRILKIAPEERARGLIAASSGNHGLSVAYVAKLVGAPTTIVVPTNAVEEKINVIEEYGARVVKHGLYHDERMSKALEIQKTTGATFVHPFDDPDVIAGQGTIGLEICEDLPTVDTVIVPVGGGGLISGVSTAVKNLKPTVKVIGVEPERASSMYQSLKAGKISRLEDTTSIADGLATREPGSLTFSICKRNVDDILLVSEQEIEKSVLDVIKECHIVVEPSASAAVAALSKMKIRKINENIVIVISGGNVSLRILTNVLS